MLIARIMSGRHGGAGSSRGLDAVPGRRREVRPARMQLALVCSVLALLCLVAVGISQLGCGRPTPAACSAQPLRSALQAAGLLSRQHAPIALRRSAQPAPTTAQVCGWPAHMVLIARYLHRLCRCPTFWTAYAGAVRVRHGRHPKGGHAVPRAHRTLARGHVARVVQVQQLNASVSQSFWVPCRHDFSSIQPYGRIAAYMHN